MFCKYCGKQTENQNGVCDECLKNEEVKDAVKKEEKANEVKTVKEKDSPSPFNKKYGFGESLASTIVGTVGYFFTILALELASLATFYIEDLSATYVVLLFGLTAGIISLVYGIKSVNKYKEAKQHNVNPVATLVLGIIGIVSAAITLFFAFIAVCIVALV